MAPIGEARPQPGCQLPFLDLAHGITGKGFHEADTTRMLEAGDPPLEQSKDSSRVKGCALAQHHGGPDAVELGRLAVLGEDGTGL